MVDPWTLENVPGYFVQSDEGTDPLTFDYTANDFGLKKATYQDVIQVRDGKPLTQWQMFELEVERLNKLHPGCYKVLFLGRHGQGFHNVAEAKYGTHDWDSYWARRDGDGHSNWVDALLTEVGVGQAMRAHDFWKQQIELQAMPAPQKYYSSPHRRCLQTARITFGGLPLPPDRPFAPEIWGVLRETYGIHTCDRLSSRNVIHEMEPRWKIADDVTEEDELWQPDVRETVELTTARFGKALKAIWETDSSCWISLTIHSGAVAGVLAAVGHPLFPLATGEVIPVLIRQLPTRLG